MSAKNHVYDGRMERNKTKYIQRKCRQKRLAPEGKQRQALVEHSFGTMKRVMGVKQFLTRGKINIAAEVASIFLCYNLKRLRKIMTQNPIKNDAFPILRAV